MKKDDKCEKTKLGRILEIGKIDEKVPQQRENQILAECRKSGKLMKKCDNSEKTKLEPKYIVFCRRRYSKITHMAIF